MKNRIYINLLSIILLFFPIVAQFFIFYIAPFFYGIYNYFACQNIKDMMKMCLISLLSQLIGLSFAEFLMYVASSDYNDFVETPAILLINLILTLIIDIIFLIVKLFRMKRNKKNEV